MLSRRPLILILIIPFVFAVSAESFSNTVFQKADKSTAVRRPSIRSATNLVLVPVSVTDPTGNPVENLKLEDFAVLDNGQTVKLQQLLKPELTKLEIILLFDITSSVWYHSDIVKESAAGFVKTIFRPGDAVSIIGISTPPEILLQRTESLPDVLDGLNRLPRGAATAFFDAVVKAARLFPDRPDPETRRVIVVLSDGEDNFSTYKLESALKEVQKADSLFYSINPGASPDRLNRVSRRGQQWMRTIAEQTGGVAFLAERFKDLGGIYDRIAEDLKVQYLLSYHSPDPLSDNGFRTISVTLPKRPELKVRARKGYYSKTKTPPTP
ncbi:MAG: VWA domain-containing protein [Acidobacteria bacterium]|nr:VWA domain-containing protein [Acidobacteriota bacterium]